MANTKYLGIMKQLVKHSNTFSGVLEKVKFKQIDAGRCIAEFKVDKELANQHGILDGGYVGMLVDATTSAALFSNKEQFGVSTDIHVTYMSNAKIGDELLIDSFTAKEGDPMCFVNCEIKNKATGEVLIKGTHSIHLLQGTLDSQTK